MNLARAVNIEDLRKIAKAYMPRIAYDFIEGGCDGEEGLLYNEDAFRAQKLVPRYLVDIRQRDQSTTLFGRTYDSPFGIAPTAPAALGRIGADAMLGQAAVEANIPYIQSGAGTASLETMQKIAKDHHWFQLYPAVDKQVQADVVRRARDAGIHTLVVTVDIPARSKRERNMRNGFTRPLSMTASTMLEALTHPAWLLAYYRNGGQPAVENWRPYAGPNATADQIAAYATTQTGRPIFWNEIEAIRKFWPGTLILKGILHPDDARRAADAGAEGVIVSNHGARQLDRAPSPLDVFPEIREAVGDRVTLMLDSGVRRGVDVFIALCLGAKFVFAGRAPLYGVCAGGLPGARKALAILKLELDTIMGQIGCPNLRDVSPDFLLKA